MIFYIFYDIIYIENMKESDLMYNMTKKTLKEIIFTNTPIDKVISTCEGPGFIEVVGCAGGDTMTYRIYENGQVTER